MTHRLRRLPGVHPVLRRLACAAPLLLALLPARPAAAQARDPDLGVGDRAPELQCQDLAGRAVTWRSFADRAVILFFHSQDMAFSRRGLEAVTQALAEAEDLHPRAALLLVTNGGSDHDFLRAQLEHSGLPGAITVDPERKTFARYHTVAFPTVYMIGTDRTIRHIAKGSGPLLPSKVLAGTRFAAGLLDADGLQQALSRRARPEGSEEALRLSRSVRMAEQLYRSNMLTEARTTLENVLDKDTTHTEGLTLLARVLLAQGDADAASRTLQRLTTVAPASGELKELRAERLLLGRDPQAALHELGGLDELDPHVLWLKGRALEQLERFREAAETYRKALEIALERGR